MNSYPATAKPENAMKLDFEIRSDEGMKFVAVEAENGNGCDIWADGVVKDWEDGRGLIADWSDIDYLDGKMPLSEVLGAAAPYIAKIQAAEAGDVA